MKKIVFVVLSLMFLSSCTVQEKMSPLIFAERIEKTDENIVLDTENAFFESEKFVCFASYSGETELVFEISCDKEGNADKINLACIQTDKDDDFIACAMSVVEAYAPDDSADEVKKNLFAEKKLSDRCIYYETQWHSYSAVMSENGLYFSAESKKLRLQSEVEFSLKQNDIVDF